MLMAAGTAPVLRQVALLDLAGPPGLGDTAVVSGMLLIGHGGAGTVDLFDPQKRRVMGHIRDMSSPRGIAADPTRKLVYIANAGKRNIVAVSTEDWQVKRIIPVDGVPDALVASPDGAHLYVTFPEQNLIVALDLTAGAQAAMRLRLEGRANSLAYDGPRHRLYLTLQDRRTVVVLSPALQMVATWTLNASEPTGMAYSSQHDRLYVAVRYAVLALDPASGKELSRSPVAGGIDQLALDDTNGVLLGQSEGEVFVIPAAAALGEAAEMTVPVKAHRFAYDAASGMIYLPGGMEGRSKLLILRRIAR